MPPSADPSVQTVLDHIQQHYPHTPFIALGQTALWDEPTKAVWRRLLDALAPDFQLIAGVHDTDYFAKTTAHIGSDRKYVALPHDDGVTRDLWSAAGEMSALFGSESVPTRAFFEKHGVPFDRLARDYDGGKDAFYRDWTTAWGWRGIVSTESHDVIAHDIPILEIEAALLEQMDWAFAESLACLGDPDAHAVAERTAAEIRSWVTGFLSECSTNCRLSDLYQTLLPRFYRLLMGEDPSQFSTTASTDLFRFNSDTCSSPRFQLLAYFLDPATRALACDAYNKAVAGSGIYTLDHFGEGAVPFDIVIPGQGRGTLRLTRDSITVETHPVPVVVPGNPVTSASLAALLRDAFGEDVVLVGKAVTLVDMLAAEFLVVFHETASGYTTRTQTMNRQLRAAGLFLELRPIVRLAYSTWDALSALSDTTAFRLPPHLADAFGTETINAPDFAGQWRSAIEKQRRLLSTVRDLHKTRDLMRYLGSEDAETWRAHQAHYESALDVLKAIAEKSETLAGRMDEHQQQWDMWKNERQGLERRKGEDWRANIEPLREKIWMARQHGNDERSLQHDFARQTALRATAFDEPLALCRDRIDATRSLLAEFRRQRRLLERSAEAREARTTIEAVTREAEMARLRLIRNAFLTTDSLEHTHLRPTAWWLPLVSPEGSWFTAIAATTQARLEDL